MESDQILGYSAVEWAVREAAAYACVRHGRDIRTTAVLHTCRSEFLAQMAIERRRRRRRRRLL